MRKSIDKQRVAGRSAALNRRRNKRFASPKAKRLFSICRWLHVYVSCLLLGLLVFFSITGLTLNHVSWLPSPNVNLSQLPWPDAQVVPETDDIPVKKFQSYIEQRTGLVAPRSVDVDLDFGELTYDYSLPSGYAFVTVQLSEQTIEIEHQSGGFVSLMNDLHKGRHSGVLWGWLIDISAALMALFGLTGMVILFQNSKYRQQGVWLLVLGVATPVILYLLTVPRL
ncbi:PepSY-associated TM helix domain-containing protein [Echinimonas agarilytica]|uniref:PepSY-associated TM helix domain-containing protein n=1 Tax=Echinimonas agarilytica TaxID=1215918 RepID=A0AA41W6H3_9GAMM|nr:PepSY-associated TM helix domain-containing protein [Echinimonas agarilytica]MCM2679408.1 PepSY-associated TM helix domain-containing protein [Echinimonas agarilytica]